jgi:cell division septal protein FtsQ
MSLFHTRKKTSPSYRAHQNARRGSDIQKLHLKVSSPRIVMIQVMRGVAKSLKIAVILAILGGIGWGGYLGINHVFFENPKYRLQEIKLETNGHLNHARVVEVAKIDLKASIFDIDAKEVRRRLKALPEVIDCSVRHRLPGTLHIDITERVPVVWLKCRKLDFPGRKNDGILADKEGITFPCEGALWETARDLPVIVIQKASPKTFHHGIPMTHTETLRALKLINRFNQENLRSEWMPERIILRSDYSMEVVCNDGTRAIFGMYDHERQMSDFIKICNHTYNTNRVISHVNLIPKKNIPVKFAGGPVLVQPQFHPESATPHEREIQSILKRN